MAAKTHRYGEYRLALDLVSGQFAAVIGGLVRMFYATDKSPEARREFVKSAYPLIEAYRQMNYETGVKFLHAEAARAGYTKDQVDVPDIVPYNPAILDIALNKMTGGTNNAPFDSVMARMVSHVEAPARYLMSDLASPPPDMDDVIHPGDKEETFEKDPLLTDDEAAKARAAVKAKYRKRAKLGTSDKRRYKFARILTGAEDCAWCFMLASRGAVYSSEKRASVGNDGEGFHDHDDCIIVPVFNDDFAFASEAGRLYDIYREAQEADTAVSDTSNDALNSLRAYLNANDVEIPDLRTLPDRKPLG
ncbi:MAG TPA: hypothetical protein VF885_12650 [Arthrobacter sp.]